MSSDNSSLLPTLLDGLKDHILFLCVWKWDARSLSTTVNKSVQVRIHCTETKNINSFPLVLQNFARVGFGAVVSSHLDKITSQFFACPCPLNLVLLNGNSFTVDLQDYFLSPLKLLFNSQYCRVLRLLQEYCIACYSVPCEELRRCPTTTTIIIILTPKKNQLCN